MKFFNRLRTQFRKRELNKELSEELAFHIEKETKENIAAGMSAEEAGYAALRKFGIVDRIKEECRDAWGLRFIDTLLQDLRFAVRMLAKNPGFTAVAVLTLALGIGVNTAAFTSYKAFFDRPLDAREPGKMVNLALILHSGVTDPYFSYPDYEAYRDHLHSFSGLIAEGGAEFLTLSDAGSDVSDRGSA